ncbi:DNA-processing protein DprA [Spirochaetia bacterium 38H-sp]|uniref:DNA-processing protein DprA n=1 Tax=Rarispira pelagica TaxID=3141764 RepID=A0ABU9UDC5_9SPIR
MSEKEFLLLCSIHLINVISTEEKLRLLSNLSSVDDFLHLSHSDVEGIINRKIPRAKICVDLLMARAERELKIMKVKNFDWTYINADNYPVLLRNSFDPPFMLFYIGCLELNTDFILSIVGTRKPTLTASRVAYSFARDVVVEGGIVVSGLANGIDTSAHKGAVEGGGKTFAVLGSGIDNIYPVTNRRLSQKIVENGGAILSEYVPSAVAKKYCFPQRNRIIACLSRGTLVVEAPKKSGALITAEYALDEGRDVFIPANVPEGGNSEGTYDLLENGAMSVVSVYEIMKEWNVLSHSHEKNKNNYNHPKDKNNGFSNPGSVLASMMEKELDGKIVRHKGDIIEG